VHPLYHNAEDLSRQIVVAVIEVCRRKEPALGKGEVPWILAAPIHGGGLA